MGAAPHPDRPGGTWIPRGSAAERVGGLGASRMNVTGPVTFPSDRSRRVLRATERSRPRRRPAEHATLTDHEPDQHPLSRSSTSPAAAIKLGFFAALGATLFSLVLTVVAGVIGLVIALIFGTSLLALFGS